MMHLDQRKQQQWQLYMASVAATTLVVLLVRENTASGMHFKLQMILTALASVGTTIEFSDSAHICSN